MPETERTTVFSMPMEQIIANQIWKKVLPEGSYNHYHVHLRTEFWKCDKHGKTRNAYPAACLLADVQIWVMNDAAMPNKQIPNTFQRKCPHSQNVFRKSTDIK